MSEAFNHSTEQSELRALRRDAFKEVKAAVTKISDELDTAEIGELENKLGPLIKILVDKANKYRDALEILGGVGRGLHL